MQSHYTLQVVKNMKILHRGLLQQETTLSIHKQTNSALRLAPLHNRTEPNRTKPACVYTVQSENRAMDSLDFSTVLDISKKQWACHQILCVVLYCGWSERGLYAFVSGSARLQKCHVIDKSQNA